MTNLTSATNYQFCGYCSIEDICNDDGLCADCQERVNNRLQKQENDEMAACEEYTRRSEEN